jgi:alpha-glucosidase (family GH31 glycosyl hydrolase)
MGTMVRFHQGDHRFWLRDEATQSSARDYLNMRYKLAPSLIAFGRTVQNAGFPMTARCDLVWPEHPEANDPSQYIHLNATLVAPLEGDNVDGEGEGKLPTSRTVRSISFYIILDMSGSFFYSGCW